MTIKLKNPFKRTESKKPQRGNFIVLDGVETKLVEKQIRFLHEALASSNFQVLTVDLPKYGTDAAKFLESYENGNLVNVTPKAAAIFYALDHFGAGEEIRNWINSGGMVISSNYSSRIAGEIGSKIKDNNERVLFYKWLNTLEYEVFNVPKPDLTIIIDEPKKLSEGRQSFLDFAKISPNTKLVNSGTFSGNDQSIHNQIWELVRRIVLRNRLT